MDAEVCPICSAGMAECGHEIVRWSYYVSEWEESALLKEAQALALAIHQLLLKCAVAGRQPRPNELWELYQESIEELLEQEGDAGYPELEVIQFALESIAALPGVVAREEGEQPTLVLWANDPQQVRADVQGLIRKYELEASHDMF